MDPRFSVVMPVRNALPFLDEAVHSILVQSCGDFEFVILDDASSDGSCARLHEWARHDARIRLIESASRLGPAVSSNRVAMAAACPIVARMDADDVAHPDRFRRELDVLDSHADAVLVGSLMDSIDAAGRLVRRRDRASLVRGPASVPIGHCTIMYRAEAFRRIGGYREQAAFFEDTDLFPRLAEQGRILLIPRALVRRRFSGRNARLCEERRLVEVAIDRYWRSVESGASQIPSAGGRVSPSVILELGAAELWAGQRPKMLGRLLRRGRLGWNAGTAIALVGAIWAAASPGSLRATLRLRDRWREAAVGRQVDDDAVYEWRSPIRAGAVRAAGVPTAEPAVPEPALAEPALARS